MAPITEIATLIDRDPKIRELLECCLNPEHPRGRNKAREFASVGIREADAEELRTALLAAAAGADAEIGVANVYGQPLLSLSIYCAREES